MKGWYNFRLDIMHALDVAFFFTSNCYIEGRGLSLDLEFLITIGIVHFGKKPYIKPDRIENTVDRINC